MSFKYPALDKELEVARDLATEAGRVLRRHLTGEIEVDHKEHGEVVTRADREVDALIRRGLEATFPDDALYTEETADSPRRLSSSRVWIVDPIDGTSNFIAKGDEFCISIGLSVQGEAVLGVIYNPVRDELFAGIRGHGITLNGVPVQVSRAEDLSTARIVVSRKELQRGLDKGIYSFPLIPVASMAYKLARVAAGMDDGVFSLKARKEWGTCAGVALVEAAGGRATLLDGDPIRFNRKALKQPCGMIASGPLLYPLLLQAVGLKSEISARK